MSESVCVATSKELLAEQGWTPTPLWFASDTGDANAVIMLLRSCVDVDKSTTDGLGGETPLCIASFRGHAVVVGMLLAAGADVNKGPSDCETPLTNALMKGHTAIVEMLVAAGAEQKGEWRCYPGGWRLN